MIVRNYVALYQCTVFSSSLTLLRFSWGNNWPIFVSSYTDLRVVSHEAKSTCCEITVHPSSIIIVMIMILNKMCVRLYPEVSLSDENSWELGPNDTSNMS
ncbi:hypothetical protein SADUNF_Sadunf06G0118200 [Salix dunnii]|uniref:Uncharacterized protein n=1 Tax=Salix dunnii TaxID=1413687 RepID=A0A835K1I4_9ROSI|nr:hypothetical protein SADUNF_Sadunf06G0118200 [Salix dunnii]